MAWRLAAPAGLSSAPRFALYSLGGWFSKYGLIYGQRYQAELAAKDQQLAALAQKNAELESIKRENQELRSLAGLKDRPSLNLVAADILSFNVFFKKRTITINRGWSDGLRENLAVVTPAGVMIGKIAELTAHTASILPATDEESALAGSPARAPDVKTIIKGKKGISLTMELIPQNTELAVGDIVVTSSLEENTPPGLPIGRVAAVAYKDGQLFKQAELEPLQDVLNLKIVSVILP